MTDQWRIQELLVGGYYKGVDGERSAGGAKRGRREAPRGGDLGRGAVAPPQYGGLGAVPPENFQKINVEIAYFSAFLQAEMVLCSDCKAGLDNKH